MVSIAMDDMSVIRDFSQHSGNNSKKNVLIKLVLSIVVFVYLFNPRFVALELRKVIDLFSLLIVLFYHLHIPVKRSNENSRRYNLLLVFLFYLIFGTCLFVLADFGNKYIFINNAYEILSCFFRSYITSRALVIVMKRYKFTWNDLTDVFAYSACIQLVCVLLAFLNPNIKSLFNGFTIANSRSDHVAFSTKYNEYRCFGLAENLFDSFGYTISLIIILTFISGLYNKNNKKIILSFFMLVMPLLNARTGMVLALLGMCCAFIIYSKRSPKQIIKIICIIVPCFLIGRYFINYLPEATREWIMDGSTSISDLLFSHNKSGIFLTLSNQFFFPDEVIFGAFGSPEMYGIGHSDVGYVQCIWKYGIVGSAFLIIGFFKGALSTAKSSQNEQTKAFILCVVILLVIYLYKMYPFVNLGSNLIIFTCLLSGGMKVAEKC